MGVFRHDAIIVTSHCKDIEVVAAKAHEFGLDVLGPSEKDTINGYSSLLVCPDGSKEGWPESAEGDMKRAKFIEYLKSKRYEDGSSPFDWAAVSYGSGPEFGPAKIVSCD